MFRWAFVVIGALLVGQAPAAIFWQTDSERGVLYFRIGNDVAFGECSSKQTRDLFDYEDCFRSLKAVPVAKFLKVAGIDLEGLEEEEIALDALRIGPRFLALLGGPKVWWSRVDEEVPAVAANLYAFYEWNRRFEREQAAYEQELRDYAAKVARQKEGCGCGPEPKRERDWSIWRRCVLNCQWEKHSPPAEPEKNRHVREVSVDPRKLDRNAWDVLKK